MQRLGRAEDVAALAVFLPDESSFISGNAISSTVR
jgi:NAD(P)-dependent dehydrogenase (short-subunit alcohol dehydrogenase family)